MRCKLTVASCLLLTTSLALAQSDNLSLDTLWRQGRFDVARELIEAQHQAGDQTPGFLLEAARCAEEMREHGLAAGLYAEYAALVADDPAAYREARRSEWEERWEETAHARGAAWISEARLELDQLLGSTKGQTGPERQLALELEAILSALADGIDTMPLELREDYPDSEVVLQAAKADLDRVGREPGEKQRIELVARFLEDYPGNYWRHVGYRYWLYSAWRMRDQNELQAAAEAYLAEYPNHPESHGSVSRYYFDANIESEAGLASAKRCVELYETVLGLDGSPASVARVDRSTRSLASQPGFLPPGRREQFLDYLGSRFNLGRYQVAAEEYDAALALNEPLIALRPFTDDEDQTTAPFYLVAAQAAEGLGDYAAAYRYYLGALVEGDSRSRFALQAAQQLPELEVRLANGEREQIKAEFVPVALANVALPQFTDISAAAGLRDRHAQRLAWGDVDSDGDPDLLLDGSSLLINGMTQERGFSQSRGFVEAAGDWGLKRGMTAGLFADVDNDGDLDLYTLADGLRADRLWRNAGEHFTDATHLAGNPTDNYDSQAAAWVDYDADGWIDLYVANAATQANLRSTPQAVGAPDRLYHNNGDGTFFSLDLPDNGLMPPFSEHLAGAGLCVGDFDNDGDQDIYVANRSFHENLLWRNNADGTFLSRARLLGLAGRSIDQQWGDSYGSVWGDVDNDGFLDLLVANAAWRRDAYACDKSMLLMSTGARLAGQFTDQRAAAGIKYAETHRDPLLADLNNDGHLDLYVTAAYTNERSCLYINDGTGRFHDVTYLAGARVLGGRGCSWADYDRDGDLDLSVATQAGVRLLRNDSPPAQWLEIRCVGGTATSLQSTGGDPRQRAVEGDLALSNAAAIGTRVTLSMAGETFIREIQSGEGIASGNDLVAHFGLGQREGRISVVVRFPSGRLATRALMTANQHLVIHELAPVKETTNRDDPAAETAEQPAAPETPAEEENGLDRPAGSRRGG